MSSKPQMRILKNNMQKCQMARAIQLSNAHEMAGSGNHGTLNHS